MTYKAKAACYNSLSILHYYTADCIHCYGHNDVYLFISTQQKHQRPLFTLSVKAQEVKSTRNMQSTKHEEIETKK